MQRQKRFLHCVNEEERTSKLHPTTSDRTVLRLYKLAFYKDEGGWGGAGKQVERGIVVGGNGLTF